MRLPGFEPGLQAWEAYVITTGPQPLILMLISPILCSYRAGIDLLRYLSLSATIIVILYHIE
jgi:hypothetical protein